MIFTTLSPNCSRGIGRWISIADGSTGGVKPLHGSIGVGLAKGVEVGGGGGGGVCVSGAGLKGVPVAAAFGSTVTSGLASAAEPPVSMPTRLLQAPTSRIKNRSETIIKRRSKRLMDFIG